MQAGLAGLAAVANTGRKTGSASRHAGRRGGLLGANSVCGIAHGLSRRRALLLVGPSLSGSTYSVVHRDVHTCASCASGVPSGTSGRHSVRGTPSALPVGLSKLHPELREGGSDRTGVLLLRLGDPSKLWRLRASLSGSTYSGTTAATAAYPTSRSRRRASLPGSCTASKLPPGLLGLLLRFGDPWTLLEGLFDVEGPSELPLREGVPPSRFGDPVPLLGGLAFGFRGSRRGGPGPVPSREDPEPELREERSLPGLARARSRLSCASGRKQAAPSGLPRAGTVASWNFRLMQSSNVSTWVGGPARSTSLFNRCCKASDGMRGA